MRRPRVSVASLLALTACGTVQLASDAAPSDSGPPRVTLTVTKLGSGTVSSDPAGLACGDVCSVELSAGTSITLLATPDEGAGFSGWSGGCSGLTPTCSLIVTADTTVGAAFGAIYVVTGTTEGAPAGTAVTASSGTAGAACSGNSCMVPAGASVTLTAPAVSGYYFAGWTGGAGCSGTNLALTLSPVNASVTCVAIYQVTFLITVGVVGGPGTTVITPSSPTPGAQCVPGSCRIPLGGSLSATAPSLYDWYFDGWSGGAVTSNATVTLSNIMGDGSLTATFVNSRVVPCLDAPPANGQTISTPNVTITYTTAGGWSTPAVCPWACNVSYCHAGAGCAIAYLDRLSFTSGTAAHWFGGDDVNTRSVGIGQGITPATTITMDRFGFNLPGGFKYFSTGQYGTLPNTVHLDRRNSTGTVLNGYEVGLAADFPGGWVYWDAPSVTLNAGTTYIFTAYLKNAFTQKVSCSAMGDAAAGYPAGSGYSGQVTSGDLEAWSAWSVHPWDFQFRIQQYNPACD